MVIALSTQEKIFLGKCNNYFLYCAAVGNAVAVIKPINLLDKAFLTQPLDKDFPCHIQRAVVDNR